MKTNRFLQTLKILYFFSHLFTPHSGLLSVLNEHNTDHFFFICMAASRASCKFLFSLSARALCLLRSARISSSISRICPRSRFRRNWSLSRSNSCLKKSKSLSSRSIFSKFSKVSSKISSKNPQLAFKTIENKLKPFFEN